MNSLMLIYALALAAPATDAPQFLASTMGESYVGEIRKIEDNFNVIFANTNDKPTPQPLIALRRAGLPLPAYPTGPQIIFANGDRIPGSLLGGDGLTIQWEAQISSKLKSKITVPLLSCAIIWFDEPRGDAVTPKWYEKEGSTDILHLRNGDIIYGTLESIAADGAGLRFKSMNKSVSREYERSAILAYAPNPSLVRMRIPKTLYGHIVLANGSRFCVKSAVYDGTIFKVVLLGNATMLLDLPDVVSLTILQGKAIYLADIKPASVKDIPYNSVVWPLVKNRNGKHQPLRLNTPSGEQTYDFGLGTHSYSEIKYDLAGKYTRFEAIVGLDSQDGKQGNVNVYIYLDGKQISLPKLMKLNAARGGVSVILDVSQARELVLRVDYGTGGDVQDVVNWADARLIQSSR